jgi:site-specific recombinase XerD
LDVISACLGPVRAAAEMNWHDLRHEGACRLLVDGVDIRIS